MAAMSSSLEPGMRVFPELRAAHLDEIDRQVPRRTIYFARNYDLGDRLIPAHCVAASATQALIALWRSDATTLELPELLWVRFLPRWLLLASAWKLRRLRGIKGSRIVFFAIENNTIDRRLFGVPRVRPIRRRCAVAGLRLLMQAFVSRCAFGTDAAAATYKE